MVSTVTADARTESSTTTRPRQKRQSPYPLWFYLPAAILFIVLFAVPTFASFYFSLTRWTLFDTEFIGLDNFRQFFSEPFLLQGFINTFIYAFLTSGAKVVLGLLLGLLLTSQHRRSRLSALGGVLPGAGVHDRHGHHVQDLDGPVRRADQQDPRACSGSPAPAG